MSQREEFEKFISSPPYEFKTARFPDDATEYKWPGAYRTVHVALAWEAWQAAQAKQAAEIEELKYINDRLQKHCSELTEQLNIALGKCASLEKANAAYRALEKKRNELSECLPADPVSGGGL